MEQTPRWPQQLPSALLTQTRRVFLHRRRQPETKQGSGLRVFAGASRVSEMEQGPVITEQSEGVAALPTPAFTD